jgi:hypothetical protein
MPAAQEKKIDHNNNGKKMSITMNSSAHLIGDKKKTKKITQQLFTNQPL